MRRSLMILAAALAIVTPAAAQSPVAHAGVFHNPAAGSQATITVAAITNRKHVADCVAFSAGSVVAPALTALTVNLRDGATGAGTVIQSWQVVIPAATGQNVAPFALCGLHLEGSTGVAMTLEFSAGLTSLSQSVSLVTHELNPTN